MKQRRKIFNYDNINEEKIVNSTSEMFLNSITACGCLIYRMRNKKVEMLLIKYDDKNWSKLDDFGGKISLTDKDIFSCAIRKTSSETNKIIDDEKIADLLCDNNYATFYNKQSKYFMYLVEGNKNYLNDTSIFGDEEKEEQIKRTISWYKYDDIKQNLSLRLLQNSKLHHYIDNLQK